MLYGRWEHVMYCPYCGKSMPDTSDFCTDCGANLREERMQAEVPAEATRDEQPARTNYAMTDSHADASTSAQSSTSSDAATSKASSSGLRQIHDGADSAANTMPNTSGLGIRIALTVCFGLFGFVIGAVAYSKLKKMKTAIAQGDAASANDYASSIKVMTNVSLALGAMMLMVIALEMSGSRG